MEKLKLKEEFKHLTVNELAEKFNVNRKTIIKYFSEDRLDYIKNNDLRRSKMYEMHLKGKSLSEIGKEFNISKSCVSKLIKKHKEKFIDGLKLF